MCIRDRDIEYSTSQLRAFNCRPRLDSVTYEYCQRLGILRRPRYIHRSRRTLLSSFCSKTDAPPCIWTNNRLSSMPRQLPAGPTIQRSLIYLTDSDLQHTPNLNPSHHHFALLNCRSISDKAPYLNEMITDNNLDIFLLTETWQVPEDFLQLNLLTPDGYKYLSKPVNMVKGVVSPSSIVITSESSNLTFMTLIHLSTWF